MAERSGDGKKITAAVLAVGLVVLAIALAFIANSLYSDNDKQEDRIAQLGERVAKAETAPDQPGGAQQRIAQLGKRVKQLEDCILEVETQINSLEIDRDTLFISPDTQISRVCQPTLYGNPGE